MTQLSLDTVVEYLIQAPRITRDMQPMHWMFIDAPQDGSVMLVWQPSAHLGTNFATDGYVWADPEQAFNSEARGYVSFTRHQDLLFAGTNVFVRRWKCGYIEPAIILPTRQLRSTAENAIV